MDGTVAASKLRSGSGKRVVCAVAGREHDAVMRRLLRENPMAGAIGLSLEREPDYFSGANLAGADDETILVFEEGRLACMGRSSLREGWLGGKPARVRYLAELRLDAVAAGRSDLVRLGYRYFQNRHRDEAPAFQFTSIASDNERARRLLESGMKGLPQYQFLGEFVTLGIPVPRKAKGALRLERGTPEMLGEIARVLDAHGRRSQLGARWTEETLGGLAAHGLPVDRLMVLREGGQVVACGGIWDQRAFRQTVIRSYSGPLRMARPVINLASSLLGTPRLPSPGSVLNHAFLSPMAFAEGRGDLLPDFVAAVLPQASALGLEFLTLGLPTSDRRLDAICRRFSPRQYRSRLYRVSWPGTSSESLEVGDAPFHPDIALL